MGLIFKDSDNRPVDPKTARTRAMLFSLPFAIVGILALVFLLHDELGSGFGMERQKAMGLLSAAVVCGGLIALIFGITAKKQALKAAVSKTIRRRETLVQAGRLGERPDSFRLEKVRFFSLAFHRGMEPDFRPGGFHQPAGGIAQGQSCSFDRAALSHRRHRHDYLCAERDAGLAKIRPKPL